MFENLIRDAEARLNLSDESVSALVRGLLFLMLNERGGIEGFVDRFRRVGPSDVVTSWLGGKEGMMMTALDVELALGMSALDRLAASSGLTRGVVGSVVAFLLPRMMSRLTANSIIPSRSSLVSQVSSYKRAVLPVGAWIESRIEDRPARPGWPRWLPWAAASAVLFALAASLSLGPPPRTIDTQLTLTNRNGQISYWGVVRDEATRSAVLSALGTMFGSTNIHGDLRLDPNLRPARWLFRLADVFEAVKTPGADVSLDGDAIKLGGWLSAADRQALTASLRGIFGAGVTIDALGDPAVEAARAANDKALSALRAIGTSGVSTDALVNAMNLAVINFATGSAEITPDSLEVIRRSARAMKHAPAGSKVEIEGHTDKTGNPASNLTLSHARADAVKAALVSAGVRSDMLTTKGCGDSKPRATNDTEFGRFQNRRIEFRVAR